MPVQSLQLSQQVLTNRKLLDIKIELLECTIGFHLMKIEEFREKKRIIKKHEAEVNANENFVVNVLVAKKILTESVLETTLKCTNCKKTCHYSCGITGGFLKLMKPNFLMKGLTIRCHVCPGKCDVVYHVNEKRKWVNKQVEERQTLNDVREKYEDARQKKLSAEELVMDLQMEVDELEDKLKQDVCELTSCLNELNIITLRGNLFTSSDYIKLMIENEKRKKKERYMERIKILYDLLEKIELTDKTRLGTPVA